MTLSLDELRSKVTGLVLSPVDDGFLEEVTGFNLLATYAPDVAVGVETEADVSEAVRFAARNGLRVHIQSTGHGADAAIDDGMLIVTKRLDTVSVDPEAGTATIGAGARWAPVVEAAGAYGLTAVTGSSPTVGAVGYTLGGGLGPLARSHGFSSDYARGFRIVTADGTIMVANATENPDLFWALRGGKAGFGVVTEMTFGLVPLAEVYGGSLFFGAEHIDTVLRGWLEWTNTAPADVSTSAAIVRFPPLDQVPEPLRGRTAITLRFVYPGDGEEGARLAEPLRALAPAFIDGLGAMPTTKMALIHNDPQEPSPSSQVGAMLTHADNDFASVFLEWFGADAQTPVVAAELRHLGNRTAIDVPEGSAVGGRENAFTLGLVSVSPPGSPVGALTDFWAANSSAIAPWISPVTTINWAGHPTAERYPSSWSPEIFARLDSIAKANDPEGLFTWR